MFVVHSSTDVASRAIVASIAASSPAGVHTVAAGSCTAWTMIAAHCAALGALVEL